MSWWPRFFAPPCICDDYSRQRSSWNKAFIRVCVSVCDVRTVEPKRLKTETVIQSPNLTGITRHDYTGHLFNLKGQRSRSEGQKVQKTFQVE